MDDQKHIRRIAIVELTFDEPEGGSDTPNCGSDGWLTPAGLAAHIHRQIDAAKDVTGNEWLRQLKVRTLMLENQS